MEKQSQFILSYANSDLSGNISLYDDRGSMVADITLSGAPDQRFKLMISVLLNIISESCCAYCILNIDDLYFYEHNTVNENAVEGIVLIISVAIEQGSNVAVITDDRNFREVIDRAFRKHRRYSRLKTYSTTDEPGLRF